MPTRVQAGSSQRTGLCCISWALSASSVAGVPAAVQALCPSMNSDCPARHHLMEALRYQPASRIPDFHLILACGYFTLGAIAVAVVWWLVRRTSLSAG